MAKSYKAKKYAVIAIYHDTGEIVCHGAKAESPLHAFRVVALRLENTPGAEFVCCVPWDMVKKIEYAGDSLVDVNTVIEQVDVFGTEKEREDANKS